MAESISIILSLFARCDLYCRLYLAQAAHTADATDRLQPVMVDIDATSLRFLGYISQVYAQSALRNEFTALYKATVVDTYLQSLRRSESDLRQAGDDCEKDRSVYVSVEQRETAQHAFDQIRKLDDDLQGFM